MGRLSGKSVLVTGAGQGIGAAIARAVAVEGGRLLLTDLDGGTVADVAASIDAAHGAGTCFALRHDVCDEAGWTAVIETARERLGGLTGLVNNAGIARVGSIESLDLEAWRQSFAVNVDGVFLGIRHALPLMRESQPGSIVNIASISSLIAAPNFAAYNASKAAVWMLTKSVALHCAREGLDIRCNSIHPAFVETAILEGLAPGRDIGSLKTSLARQVPLGRLGAPEDVAHATVYLLADESRFMTGSEIKLDGGISAQ